MTTRDDKGQPTRRRWWLAVLLATVLMVLSYVMFIYALVAASGDELVFAGGLLGIALGLVPGVFAVAAFVSNNPKTLTSTLGASAIWLVVTGLIGFGSLPVGLVAGYGAGGVVAFRLSPGSTRGSRAVAVVICATYTLVLQRLLPEAGLFAGAPLPFAAIALADYYRERFADEPATVD